MSEELVNLLRSQMENERRRYEEDKQRQERFMLDLLEKHGGAQALTSGAISKFEPFDPSEQLWKNYWDRFLTFSKAHSISDEKQAQIFLTNQTTHVYQMLSTLASQLNPAKNVNDLTIAEIKEFMETQYDAKRFIVRERYKFWSQPARKPGETVNELAARIRQKASTCDFPSITDALDEAMRTAFVCLVNNEAATKALFKVKDDELSFNKAVEVAKDIEDTSTVAKDTVYGSQDKEINKVHSRHFKPWKSRTSSVKSDRPTYTCYRCGKTGHKADDCRFRNSECRYCKRTGHIESACRSKQRTGNVKVISKEEIKKIKSLTGDATIPKLLTKVDINGKQLNFELDTGACANFITDHLWKKIGSPKLEKSDCRYESATKHSLPTFGHFTAKVKCDLATNADMDHKLQFMVTKIPHLNLLGRNAIHKLGISMDHVLSIVADYGFAGKQLNKVKSMANNLPGNQTLKSACQQLCDEFPDLFKSELGCLKDFELDVKFKEDAKPKFCKPRPVPFAILDELAQVYEAGINKGVWKLAQFNEYGTPVVPIRKAQLPGTAKPALRVCGDYSVTVNPQLETHRQPIPLPEDLMRKLGGGHCFTKIDLADAYNQIELSPESQKRLALSTHKGVLLQMRLPFGISSAPGYFQEIMEQLTRDIPGVAVYLDDLLVSGTTAEDHLKNLRLLLARLQEKGLRCRLEKCEFAETSVEYLGHVISKDGISKGHKVDGVLNMPAPTDISTLRSFLSSVQFYGKFLNNLSTVSEPLHKLTRKGISWKWEDTEKQAFEQMKQLLMEKSVLVHFDPTLPIGLSCDASSVGIGVVLFHRYEDGSERPIANASKTLTKAERNYSQIQREALSIIYGLKKFHQYLYGRRFILITDHKPLLALFAPEKATSALAANRLARWSLLLGQYDYSIEYRRTAKHGNADALSRLPVGPDVQFEREESGEDVDTICTINTIGLQVKPHDSNSLKRETNKDPVISKIIKFTREGWPMDLKEENNEIKCYHKVKDSLSTCNGCLLYGCRVVIPSSMRKSVLGILHLGHFGMERMKQLARTAVYWPNIDNDIMDTCRNCTACGEHQSKPSKPPVHPWMLPEKPWSRIHVDHAINFLGSNWLVIVDAYSKYPCIHITQSTSTKATTDILEQDFAHFGYPHSIVTDNATTFVSSEFKEWCKERGIMHLTGAPYHPATNGAAERMVQSFKRALRKSTLSPKAAIQQFLIQYRRTPTINGYSPSEMLNGRQIRTKIDSLLPSPVHLSQGLQSKFATKEQCDEARISKVIYSYHKGDTCYALHYGPKSDRSPRWVPAIVIRHRGTRCYDVRVVPRGPTWRRHLEQLKPRYSSSEDNEPPEEPLVNQQKENAVVINSEVQTDEPEVQVDDFEVVVNEPERRLERNNSPDYRLNPRRSTRQKKPRLRKDFFHYR